MTREQAVEAVLALRDRYSGQDARDHFAAELDRLDALSMDAAGLHFDFSKHPFSQAEFDAMLVLASASGMESSIRDLLAGARANSTEKRAAQHAALREGGADSAKIDRAESEKRKAFAFANALRNGAIRTAAGGRFTHILHIGIGGSDLGPRLINGALARGSDPIAVRFLSSIDPEAFASAVDGLDPSETLIFVVSKSFGTPETTLNLAKALSWMKTALADRAGEHLAAATANREAALTAGIDADRVFEMWDWVGGRYSLWSAVSLSVMAAIGPEAFERLLGGARRMDEHFGQSELAKNAPVVSALAIYWHQLARGVTSWAVVPYAFRLRLFVGWLEQLSMESLGKRIDETGKALTIPSGPTVWGGEGPDGQHAFFQLLHQGTEAVPVDIIAFAHDPHGARQDSIVANAIAQSEALLTGRKAKEIRAELTSRGLPADEIERLLPHMEMTGGRGSTFIMADKLDPQSLGALLAFYEHQTFALSVLMGINAFDQFGVELGKKLARQIEADLGDGKMNGHDPSTNALLALVNRRRTDVGDSGA